MDTAQLSAFVIETKGDSIPEVAIARARDAVLDSLAVAIGGVGEEPSRIAIRYAESTGSAKAVPLWGTQVRTAPADAAFVNAVSGHALDFDDSLPSLCGHPSVPLCATGFAAAAGLSISGAAFLSAFVLSLEVAGKIAHHPRRLRRRDPKGMAQLLRIKAHRASRHCGR